jgi:Ca-activated chloride channel family protein
VGLVSFAGFADGLTPPTLDHAFVVGQLNSLRIVSKRQEDGTAIGDALSLAVEKLNSLDARYANKVKSKIIILLTDGENTAGQLTPQQGAELAETMGIKVYTIGVGTKGRAPIPVMDPFSGRQVIQWMQVTIDEESLQQVAELTGGKYFRATDTRSLENIYAEIDRLEKTKVESRQFVDYRELAVQSYQTGFIELPPLVLLAFILLILRSILVNTWLREFV